MVGVATTEELLFRGVLFRIVEGWLGTWGALAVTGLLFGALHLVNPGASVVGALALAIEAGLTGQAWASATSVGRTGGGGTWAARLRSRKRWILPVAVRGSSLISTTCRGRLNDARPARQNAITSSGSIVAPGFGTT